MHYLGGDTLLEFRIGCLFLCTAVLKGVLPTLCSFICIGQYIPGTWKLLERTQNRPIVTRIISSVIFTQGAHRTIPLQEVLMSSRLEPGDAGSRWRLGRYG